MLTRLQLSEASTLAVLANNKKISDCVRDLFPHPYSEKDALAFISKVQNQEPVYTFGIRYKNSLAGVISLEPKTDVHRKTAEIGYWVGEPYWGLGIATHAVTKMIDYAFHDLDLIRLEAGVFEFNKASCSVLEKSGFQQEGVFRKSIIKNGIIHDEIRYGMVHPQFMTGA